MRNLFIVMTLLILSGCTKPVPEQSKFIAKAKILQRTIDSLETVLDHGSLKMDSLSNKLRQQRVLIRFTAAKCHKYALIVKKNPAQSIFIVGWIDRAFSWVDEK